MEMAELKEKLWQSIRTAQRDGYKVGRGGMYFHITGCTCVSCKANKLCLLGAVIHSNELGSDPGSFLESLVAKHLGISVDGITDLEHGFEGWCDPKKGNAFARLGAEIAGELSKEAAT